VSGTEESKMSTNQMRARSFELTLGALLALGAVGCGGSQKQPEQPPLLEQTDEKVAAPSSKKVQAGLDAIKAEKFAEAETLLAEASRETPEDPQAAYYYGVALEGVGKGPEAETSYKRALTLEPKLTEASQNLSALLLDAERPADSLAVADAGLKNTPEDPGLLSNRALSLDALESPEAIPAYEKALAKKPDEPWLRYNYAAVLALNEKPAEAKKELVKVPLDDPQLAAGVAQLYGQLKDFPACVAALDKAIAKNKTTDLLLHRGVCKHSAGDDAGAGADIKAAVDADPTSAAAHYYYGKHLAGAKKAAEAKTHLQKAAELGKGTPIGDKAAQALAELSGPAKKK